VVGRVAGAKQAPRKDGLPSEHCAARYATSGVFAGGEADFVFNAYFSFWLRTAHASPCSIFNKRHQERRPVTPREDKAMMWKCLATNCAALAFAIVLSFPAIAADDGWHARVGEVLGKTGSTMPRGSYRVGPPRTDLKVALDGSR